MIQVTRKDGNEANENLIRRFNRKVLQSGVIATAKATQRFSKPISKPERRKKAIIRRERRALNERIEKFTSKEIGSRYGVRFHAVDLTDILPPDELADALNAVISAQSIADAEYFHAEGEQQKRTLAAREGVDIARRHAHAEELEIDQLGTYLRELHERGVLHDYVERRRAEVTAESRAVFFNQGAS